MKKTLRFLDDLSHLLDQQKESKRSKKKKRIRRIVRHTLPFHEHTFMQTFTLIQPDCRLQVDEREHGDANTKRQAICSKEVNDSTPTQKQTQWKHDHNSALGVAHIDENRP